MPDYAATLGPNSAIIRSTLENVGAFDPEAPTGTDYVLSKQLTTASYPIRFVRGSRVQTRYPQTLSAYWRQQSRWFRNPIVHGRQWGEKDLLISHLWAGITSLGMLLLPLAGVLQSKKIPKKTLRSIWASALSHLLLTQFRLEVTSHAYYPEKSYHPLKTITILPFMILSWLVMAASFLEILLPVNRKRW